MNFRERNKPVSFKKGAKISPAGLPTAGPSDDRLRTNFSPPATPAIVNSLSNSVRGMGGAPYSKTRINITKHIIAAKEKNVKRKNKIFFKK